MTTTQMRARLAAVVLPALLIASSGCDIAMADFREKQTAEWNRTYELAPGGRFELSNVNGRIQVQPGTGNTIEVRAEKIARAPSVDAAKQALDRAEIRETVSRTGVTLETRLNRTGLLNGGNVEIRYTVRVPAAADVKVTTTNGGIEVSDLTGRLELGATNGGIRATGVSGTIDASTTNGGVDVDLSSMPKDGVKLGCTNGGIKLRLPADSRATIAARITNGGIDVSGLEIASAGEVSRRRLSGTMNGGGPRIDLEGTNGGIRLTAR